MGIRTVLLYLIGNRQAILTLAASRWTLLVGLCFVFTAAFAREYDGKDLLYGPWHLVVPAIVSAATAFLLLGFAWVGRDLWHEIRRTDSETYAAELTIVNPQENPRFISAYLAIVGLFWMTAPLAWLYAIPYERFLDSVDAAKANIASLGFVALWRVALMIRVFNVLLGLSVWIATVTVLVVADCIAFVSMFAVPNSVVATMGGLRLSESEEVVVRASSGALQFSCCALPILLIVALTMLSAMRVHWTLPLNPMDSAARPTRMLWILCFCSLAAWVFILPFTQPEQQLRRKAEELFQKGDLEGALAFMSSHWHEEFPPHWEPPTRWRGEALLCDVFDLLELNPAAPWARTLFVNQLQDELVFWSKRNREEDMERLRAVLYRIPEKEAILANLKKHDSNYVTKVLTPPQESNKKLAD